jgi:ABC-type protease/lipase transport system fused ATPase/permease subunit
LRAGKVKLDGADIVQWNQDELGKWIGYLPQDVELFDGTVAENIARFTKTEDSQIIMAALVAGVDDLIRELPEGYNTRIGAGGVALSGGQRQRIALARALFGQPPIVVLDEPNANLDEKGELALAMACNHLKKNGTTLILASHRRRILGMADKILSLEDGRLHMFGPRDAVMERLYKPKSIDTEKAVARKDKLPPRQVSLESVAVK